MKTLPAQKVWALFRDLEAGLRPLTGLPSTRRLDLMAYWAWLNLPHLSRNLHRLFCASEER